MTRSWLQKDESKKIKDELLERGERAKGEEREPCSWLVIVFRWRSLQRFKNISKHGSGAGLFFQSTTATDFFLRRSFPFLFRTRVASVR